MVAPARCSEILREWEPRALSLTHADARFLLTCPPHQLSLTPSGDRWVLTFKNHAGVLALPSLDVFVRPKINSGGVLSYMLSYAFELLELRTGIAHLAPDDAIPHAVLMSGFFLAVERLFSRGLISGYVAAEDYSLPAVRGRIDVVEQLRRNSARPDRIACRYEELTLDIPEHRLINAAIDACARVPLQPNALRQHGRRLLRRLLGVGMPPARTALGYTLNYNRLNQHYRKPHDLARMILRQQPPGFAPGTIGGSSFLVNMFELWERFIAQWIRRRFDDHPTIKLQTQTTLYYSEGSAERPNIWGVPDIVVHRAGGTPTVIDTKYKDPERKGIDGHDVAQLVTYAHCIGAKRAILLYPSDRPRPTVRYPITNTDIVVEVEHIHVSAGVAVLEAEMERFSASLV